MAVVVEALAFAGAFFIWYNISIHHRQRATRLSHSSFFICDFHR
nr:MAG TPA: hypothetical protein [Caudoviricetes sp.]